MQNKYILWSKHASRSQIRSSFRFQRSTRRMINQQATNALSEQGYDTKT